MELDLNALTNSQKEFIVDLAEEFKKPYISLSHHADSNLIDSDMLNSFGDYLRVHHFITSAPLSKERFEFALESVMKQCGRNAKLASTGNPGHDITIGNEAFSLKTQADKGIKVNHLHISKFMELGKGDWGSSVEDLVGLRNQFFSHLEKYERILSLRYLRNKKPTHHYELVEIPKSLLLEAENGSFRIMEKSKQNPKPGYCDVFGDEGDLKMQLYFDGGGERKLQIKKIDKNLCTVHADWKFE